MDEMEKFLKRWKSQGRRMTKNRSTLLELFVVEDAPLSIQDLQKKLAKKRLKTDLSTIYRELDFLKTEGFLTELSMSGEHRYERAQQDHHHHLYCERCKKIEDVLLEGELTELERNIQKKKHFKILFHSLEFFGICSNCR